MTRLAGGKAAKLDMWGCRIEHVEGRGGGEIRLLWTDKKAKISRMGACVRLCLGAWESA